MMEIPDENRRSTSNGFLDTWLVKTGLSSGDPLDRLLLIALVANCCFAIFHLY